MTASDAILIFIGMISLLVNFGCFLIALLAWLDRDRDHKQKNNAHPVTTRMGASR